jgi:hypothetical protein
MRFPIARVVNPLALAAGLLTSAHASAADIDLDFSTLPSRQGWTYDSCSWGCYVPPEASTFTVDGSTLRMDSMGTGLSVSDYRYFGAVDPTLPFTISATLRVPAYETTGGAAGRATTFDLVADTGTQEFGVNLNSNTMAINVGGSAPTIYIPIDATVFHNYMVKAVPNVSDTIFVDGVMVYSGAPMDTGNPDALYIGNASSYENGIAELTSYRFLQAVPEPTAVVMFSLGIAALCGLGMRRARRQVLPD